MVIFTVTRGEFTISTDPARLNLDMIEGFIRRSYWASNRPRVTIEKTIANSLCFGIYKGDLQVGFARVVTDYATFGWLCDVFVDENMRGQGLGKWLVETITTHPDLVRLRRFLLATRDAHELYAQYGGFTPLTEPERWMQRFDSNQ